MGLDFKLAVRQFARRRLVTAATILVLGAGLALNVSLFAIVDGILLKPLPFLDPGQLVLVQGARGREGASSSQPLTLSELDAVRQHTSVFESVAAIGPGDLQDPDGGGDALAIQHRQITPELFGLLGVKPLTGRDLLVADTEASPRNAVIGYALWRSRFGADPSLIGQTATISGASVRIVGVMPAGFEFPFGANVWTALVIPSEWRRFAYLEAVARLKSGVSFDAARERLISAGSARQGSGASYQLQRMSDGLEPKHNLTMVLLLGTGLIALTIAWIQVAAGQLSVATDHSRATAIQVCLGASRGRLLRQFAMTGALLATAALGIAVIVAPSLNAALISWLPSSATTSHDVVIGFRTLLFAAAASLLGVIVFSVAPALVLRDSRIADLIGGRTTILGGHPNIVRSVLIVTQVALACCLAHLGAVAAYSALRIGRADLGFNPVGLISVRIPIGVIPVRESGRLRSAIDGVMEDIGPLSGVTIALSDTVPFGGGGFYRSAQPSVGDTPLVVKVVSVSDSYFAAMGTSLRAGRIFQPDDTTSSVVVINERLSKLLGSAASVVDTEILVGGLRQRVVGVVADMKDESAAMPARPIVYTYSDRGPAERVLLLRSDESSLSRARSALIRSLAVRTGAAPQAFTLVEAEHAVYRSTAIYRARSFLLSLLSGIVLGLTSIGIFTSVSSLVNRCLHDIGVRLALGAAPTDVRNWVFVQAMLLVAGGIVLGLLVGVGTAYAARSLLFEVAPFDALSVVSVVMVFTVVAASAAAIPAVRASRCDPVEMLRES
jgi:putative ABC transport system permease protein